MRRRRASWIARSACSRKRALWETPAMPRHGYRLRERPKAKNLRLRVTPEEGLAVIVPRGFDLRLLPGILKKKREWIDSALEKARSLRRFFEKKPIEHFPD